VFSAIAISLLFAGEGGGNPADSVLPDSIAGLKERVMKLEARVRELEESQEKLRALLRRPQYPVRQGAFDPLQEYQKMPDEQSNFGNGLLIAPPGANKNSGQTIPPNWTPHEFNGGTYYIVPLSQKPY
jgi:hypothetical protein